MSIITKYAVGGFGGVKHAIPFKIKLTPAGGRAHKCEGHHWHPKLGTSYSPAEIARHADTARGAWQLHLDELGRELVRLEAKKRDLLADVEEAREELAKIV